MTDRVQFDEDQNFDPIPQPKLEPPTFGDSLLKSGVLSNPGDLAIMLGIFALLLIAGSFYLIASSVPPPSNLGEDILRPGEVPPNYVGN